MEVRRRHRAKRTDAKESLKCKRINHKVASKCPPNGRRACFRPICGQGPGRRERLGALPIRSNMVNARAPARFGGARGESGRDVEKGVDWGKKVTPAAGIRVKF